MRTGCVICSHKKIDEINKRLINKSHSGESFQTIADYFGLSKTTLLSHFNGNPDKNEPSHIVELLSKSTELRSEIEGDMGNQTLTEIRALKTRALDILERAQEAGDLKTALLGIREARSCLELCMKAEGQLNDAPQINILINPQWVELKSLIISTLKPYPDAYEALIDALP